MRHRATDDEPEFTPDTAVKNLKKRVFPLIQPTGKIHIGNYLGAIRYWVDAQPVFDNIFCIVDLHAITTPQDPEEFRVKIRETAGLLLAAGIGPSQSVLYLQSKYKVLMEDPDNIEHLLIEGAEKIRPIADSVLNTVKKRVGLI